MWQSQGHEVNKMLLTLDIQRKADWGRRKREEINHGNTATRSYSKRNQWGKNWLPFRLSTPPLLVQPTYFKHCCFTRNSVLICFRRERHSRHDSWFVFSIKRDKGVLISGEGKRGTEATCLLLAHQTENQASCLWHPQQMSWERKRSFQNNKKLKKWEWRKLAKGQNATTGKWIAEL